MLLYFLIICALFLSLSFITCLYNVLSFSLFSHIMFLSFLFIKLSHFLIFSHSMLLRVFLPCFFWWICSKKPSSFYSRVVCPKLIFQFCFILPLFWNLSLVCFIHVFLPNFYIFSYLALYLHLSVMTVRASLFTCINISVFVCIYLNFSFNTCIYISPYMILHFLISRTVSPFVRYNLSGSARQPPYHHRTTSGNTAAVGKEKTKVNSVTTPHLGQHRQNRHEATHN